MHLYKLPEEISTRRRATISLLNPPYPSFKVGTLLESWREAALDPFWRLSSKLCFCVDPSYKTRPLYSSGFFSPFRPLGSHRSRLHQVESHCMRQSPFNGTDINLFALSTTWKKPFGWDAADVHKNLDICQFIEWVESDKRAPTKKL